MSVRAATRQIKELQTRPSWAMRLLFAPLLVGALLLAACAAGESNRGPEVTPTTSAKQPSPDNPVLTDLPTPAAKDVSPAADLEADVREQVNAIRQEHGLEALEQNPELAEVARNYSCRMAEQGFIGHVDPQSESPADRVRDAGISFQAVGENIGFNANAPAPVDRTVEGWMNSEGHRENILRDIWTQTGVGVCQRGTQYFFTLLFMRPL